MPVLDDQAFRWFTLAVPLVQVLLTAVVTAIVAVWATKSEAGRAEKRALAESERAEARARAAEARAFQVAVLRHTHDGLLTQLERTANTAMGPGQDRLDLASLAEDVTLVDDLEAVRDLMRLTTDLAARPAGYGVSEPELKAIADLTNSLRASLARQTARVMRGEEPVRVAADAAFAVDILHLLERLRLSGGSGRDELNS